MRGIKRLFCAALACLLLFPAALADDEAEPSAPPAQETEAGSNPESDSVSEATPAPESSAADAPSPTPAETPEEIPEPEAEPSPSPDSGEQASPEAETDESSDEEPADLQDGEPDAPACAQEEPAPAPEANVRVSIASPQGAAAVDGTYQIDAAQTDAIAFAWDADGVWDGFDVSVTGDSGSVYSARQGETSLTLSTAELAEGRYALTVSALSGDAVAGTAQLRFELLRQSQTDSSFPESGLPEGIGGFGGFSGMRRGSFSGRVSGGASAAGLGETQQSFHVTPGEALTSSHVSGSKDARLYGTVSLSPPEEAMTALTLGGEALEIELDGGEQAFTASIDGDVLSLIPESGGAAWSLNGFALKTLARSGIDALSLALDGAEITFPAEPLLQGAVYAALRAEGYVSADYTFTVSADGTVVSVDGMDYQWDESGTLIPVEG